MIRSSSFSDIVTSRVGTSYASLGNNHLDHALEEVSPSVASGVGCSTHHPLASYVVVEVIHHHDISYVEVAVESHPAIAFWMEGNHLVLDNEMVGSSNHRIDDDDDVSNGSRHHLNNRRRQSSSGASYASGDASLDDASLPVELQVFLNTLL